MDLMTELEHNTVELLGKVSRNITQIAGRSERVRSFDLAEAVLHIHSLQHMVMAQAAARAYPDRYRLIGGTISS